jgi:hypothetical protein
MTNTTALRKFATDEQILECLIMFEHRKMDAAKMLSSYVFPKWQITTIDAVKILTNIQKEWSSTNSSK